MESQMKTISDIPLKDKDKRAIQKACSKLKEKYDIQEMILFGSKARGDDDEDSDIDLLLLTVRPIHWKERRAIINTLFDIELTYDVLFNIIVHPISEWYTGICTVFPIYDEISKDGVLAQ